MQAYCACNGALAFLVADFAVCMVGCLCSALGKWGRAQMGSDGFNRILTRILPFRPCQGTACTLTGPPKHMISRDFNQNFNWIPWNLVKIWLKLLDPLLSRLHLPGVDLLS